MFGDKVFQFRANFTFQHCVDFVAIRSPNVDILKLQTAIETIIDEDEHITSIFEAFDDLTESTAGCLAVGIARASWKVICSDWKFIVALLPQIFEVALEDSLKYYFNMTIGDRRCRSGDCGVYAMHLYLQNRHGDLPIFHGEDPLSIIRQAYLRICRDYPTFSDAEKLAVSDACRYHEHFDDIINAALHAANYAPENIDRFYEEIVKTEKQFLYNSNASALYCDGALLMAAANLILHEHGKPASITEDVTLTTVDEMIRMKMCQSLKPNHYYFVNSSNMHFVLCWIGDSYDAAFSGGDTSVIAAPSSPQKRRSDGSWMPKTQSIKYSKPDKMRYLNISLVKLLYERCIPTIVDTSYTDGKKFQYPLPPDSLDNLVLLVSSTQSGKTDHMISMIWTSFFLYGFSTYYFVRNSAEEYAALKNAIFVFNNKIMRWIQEHENDEEYRWVFENGGYDASHYCIHCITQQDTTVRQMNADYFYIDGQNRNMLRCLVRCKILVSTNLNTTAEHEKELRLVVQHYGAHQRPNTCGNNISTSYSLNVVFIIDEAQNSFSHALSRTLRYAPLQKFHDLLNIGGVFPETAPLGCTLSQAVALFIETSATPEASLLYVKNQKKPHILQLPLSNNYFGYSSKVPVPRRIDPRCIEEDLLGLPPDHLMNCTDDALKDYVRDALYTFYDNSMEEQLHAIVLVRNTQNQYLEDFAVNIINSPRIQNDKLSRPVVIHLAYGRSGNHGSAIVFNETAKTAFEKYLLDADRTLFISKPEISTKHKQGEYVRDPDDPEKEVMYVNRRLSENNIEIIPLAPGVYKVGLLRTVIYRVRTQLSLTHEVMRRAGMQNVFAVTLGDRLLKEGIVVKTWSHEMPPKALICGYSHGTFLRKALDELLQAVGRLCGKRNDNCCPSLYMIGLNARQFSDIIQFDEAFLASVIRCGSRMRTVEEIIRIGMSQQEGIERLRIDNRLTSQRINEMTYYGNYFIDHTVLRISSSVQALREFLTNQRCSMRRVLTTVLQTALSFVEEDEWSSSIIAEDVNATAEECFEAFGILKSLAQNDEISWIKFSEDTAESVGDVQLDEVLVIIRDTDTLDVSGDTPTQESAVFVHNNVGNAFVWCCCTGETIIQPRASIVCSECGWETHLRCYGTEVENAETESTDYACVACKNNV